MYVHVSNFLNYPSSLFTLCFPLSVSRIPLLIISYKIESGNSPALLLSSLTKAVNLVRACVKALRAAAHRNAHRWICKCEWANSLRVGRTTPNINGVNYIIFEKKRTSFLHAICESFKSELQTHSPSAFNTWGIDSDNQPECCSVLAGTQTGFPQQWRAAALTVSL